MMTDSVADFLTRVRNASMARHDSVTVPYSKLRARLSDILAAEGFVKTADTGGAGRKIVIALKYDKGGRSIIQGIRRVSRPGRRVYVHVEKIPKVMNGLGVAVLSTSKGVMTDREAREMKIGGEHLLNVW